MVISFQPGKESRSKIGKIATAIALAFVICSVSVGPARADDHRGHDDRGGAHHHDNRNHGERGRDVYAGPQPDYYYAPGPNYYTAPEPDYYYAPQPEYEPPPPPQGINLFFGF
jgi:hypothetical protein